MIKVSIIGATGYAGVELTRLLYSHPGVKLTNLVSKSYSDQSLNAVYPNFNGVETHILKEVDLQQLIDDSDCIFTSLPHGAGDEIIPDLYKAGKVVIDLSGDYRYSNVETYEKWYNTTHKYPDLLKESVYGLPELHKEKIKAARLVGNPGCYTTCSILALAPLVKAGLIDTSSIIIDAKSGTSGAGRGLTEGMQFCEVNENTKAYKVATHRHTSEIEQELSLLANEEIQLSFTPHLLPVQRGILATSYANLQKNISGEEVEALYRSFYSDAPFVVVKAHGNLPEIKHVAGSNFIHIGFVIDKRLNRIIVVSCIDNLIKGAAGQAIQNMNLIFGFDETCGLMHPAWYL